ncbi:Levanase precursor [Acidipropionibacterium jensenii]|uniref:Levanase n=2 Tax=Acidipropionibacterium jensenii TaxID=1749 RepID=A0A448P0B7_9ACTN|nr:glycoside hydrolase family 32 protein [Acidipropionibacterium jensenii]VEI03595.1 Levanase precursor [Acidipropionibacterium jensenii]
MIETLEGSRPGEATTAATAERNPSIGGSGLPAPVSLLQLPDGCHLFCRAGDRWSQAVSSDLLHWRHIPTTDHHLPADSGCVVADGADLVALLLHHGASDTSGSTSSVTMARSTDSGRTWHPEPGPVVDVCLPGAQSPVAQPSDLRVIRDEAHDQWVMVVADGTGFTFLVSTDLTSWTATSVLDAARWHEGGALCHPDLLPLDLEGQTRWVLWWTSAASPRTNGSTTRYLVGDWDGRAFTPQRGSSQTGTPASDPVLRTDLGRDLYAPISVQDASGRRIMIAAVGNEDYADLTPGSTATPDDRPPTLATPRELRLVHTPAGPRLVSAPVTAPIGPDATSRTVADRPVTAASNPLSQLGGRALDAEIELEASAYDSAGSVTLQIRCDGQVHTDLVWRPAEGSLTLDRSESGATEFSPSFTAPSTEPGVPAEGLLRATSATVTTRWPQSCLGVMRRAWLRVVVNPSSVEVFSPDGLVAITSVIFPGPGATGLRLAATSGTARLVSATVHPIAAS